MIEVARAEMDDWTGLSRGLVMIILFSFIHRYVTGRTVVESFFSKKEVSEPEYYI